MHIATSASVVELAVLMAAILTKLCAASQPQRVRALFHNKSSLTHTSLCKPRSLSTSDKRAYDAASALTSSFFASAAWLVSSLVLDSAFSLSRSACLRFSRLRNSAMSSLAALILDKMLL